MSCCRRSVSWAWRPRELWDIGLALREVARRTPSKSAAPPSAPRAPPTVRPRALAGVEPRPKGTLDLTRSSISISPPMLPATESAEVHVPAAATVVATSRTLPPTESCNGVGLSCCNSEGTSTAATGNCCWIVAFGAKFRSIARPRAASSPILTSCAPPGPSDRARDAGRGVERSCTAVPLGTSNTELSLNYCHLK